MASATKIILDKKLSKVEEKIHKLDSSKVPLPPRDRQIRQMVDELKKLKPASDEQLKLEKKLHKVHEELENLPNQQFPEAKWVSVSPSTLGFERMEEKKISEEFEEVSRRILKGHKHPELVLEKKKHRVSKKEKKAMREAKRIERKIEKKEKHPHNELMETEAILKKLKRSIARRSCKNKEVS